MLIYLLLLLQLYSLLPGGCQLSGTAHGLLVDTVPYTHLTLPTIYSV